MRAFERGSERWEIELDGSTIVTRRSVHGASPATEIHPRRTAIFAKWDADRMCAAKMAEGFLRLPGDDYVELADADFEAALAADPDDIESYVVYGDWLAERGDAWGQLIGVQHALAELPRFGASERRDKLQREQAMLLFRNAARLWGWLGETIVDQNTQTYACDLLEPSWDRGFVREVTLQHLPEHGAVDFATLVSELARLPIASLLRTIVLVDDDMPASHLASLAAHSWPHLTRLEVRNEFGYSSGGELFDAAPLAPLLSDRAPALKSFLLIGATHIAPVCRALAASPVAPQLTSLGIERCHWSEEALAALAAGAFGALDQLRVSGAPLPVDTRERLRGVARRVHVDIRDALEEEEQELE